MRRTMYLLLPMLMLLLPVSSNAQRFEVSGGWVHVSGDNGLDGYNLGGSIWITHHVTIAGLFDNAYDTSTIGNFTLTSLGQTAVKGHMINYLFGPRVFLNKRSIYKTTELMPFVEAQFGGTHLHTSLQSASTGFFQEATANGFSWMLGGGADYFIARHFALRGNLDLLRTHLANEGQSHLRFVLGLAYTFGER